MKLSELVDELIPKVQRIYDALAVEQRRRLIHGGTNQSPRAAASSAKVNLVSLQRMCHGWPAVPEQGVVGEPPWQELADLEV